jgi:hypothetical protein
MEKIDVKKLFKCEDCGFYYRTKELAEECFSWCRERKMCNSEITKKSVPPEEIKMK